jgi:hypothetical protein
MNTELNDHHPHAYEIRLKGRLDQDFLQSYCPAGTTLTCEEGRTCLSNIRTDQSGIIGLLRNLHNLGFIILSLHCC